MPFLPVCLLQPSLCIYSDAFSDSWHFEEISYFLSDHSQIINSLPNIFYIRALIENWNTHPSVRILWRSLFIRFKALPYPIMSFPGSSDGKASAYNEGGPGSIPGSGRSPGEGKVTHSSIHAWKIPWAEEAGGLQSMGWQRVGHDWATSLHFTLQ